MPHTPGPWELQGGRCFKTSGGEFYLSYGKDRYGNPLWQHSFCELDANARLIAQAPAMLEACEMAYCALLNSGAYRVRVQLELCQLRNTIAQATGHSAEDVQNECESRAILRAVEG